jgi:hypothetical protein
MNRSKKDTRKIYSSEQKISINEERTVKSIEIKLITLAVKPVL